MNRLGIITVIMAIGLSACSAPSIHPLYAPGSLIEDSGLIGVWATEGSNVTRVEISRGAGGKYLGALTAPQNADPTTALNLEVSLTQIGEDQYVDLYLAKSDREKLMMRYGFLALPVHQFMMFKREGDVVEVRMFNAGWIQKAGAENAFASEVLPIGSNEIAVITANTGPLDEFLREHAHDPGALAAPLVLHRVQ